MPFSFPNSLVPAATDTLGAFDIHQSMSLALDRIRRRVGVPSAFGGVVDHQGRLVLDHFAGATTGALRGLELHPHVGLGGRAAALRRPIAINDYVNSRIITHQFDAAILAEGMRSLAAAPVIVDGRTVAVFYGALHTQEQIGGRLLQGLIDEARAYEHRLILRSASRQVDTETAEGELVRLQSRMRSAYASLRALASKTDDVATRQAISVIVGQLDPDERPEVLLRLTPRELDVLALVGAGLSNRSIAARLGLGLYTIKGYVKSAMAKLDAETRFAAAVKARSSGLLP